MSDPNPPVGSRVPVAIAPAVPGRYASPGTIQAVISPLTAASEGHDNPGRIIAAPSYPGEDSGPVSGVVAATGFSATPQVPIDAKGNSGPGVVPGVGRQDGR
jgi:hypothetical protein